MANLDKANQALNDAMARAGKVYDQAHGVATKASLSSSQVLIGVCGFCTGGGLPMVLATLLPLGAVTAPLTMLGACLGGAGAILMARGREAIRRDLDFEGEARRVDALIARRDRFKPSSEEYREINEEIRASNRLLFRHSPLALPAPLPKLPAPASPPP